MKKFKLFAPLSILAMSLVACGGGSGDNTPEWAKVLVNEGYTYSEAMPSDETIKAALGLDYFEFPPLANVTGYAFIYNEAQPETETSYGTAQNFNIIIEGDYIEPLSDLLGDFGFEVHASDGYYWSLDSEREALYEIDFEGLSSLESEDSGEEIDEDSILDELDLARRTVRAEDEEEEAPINYTSITVYSVTDLWTLNKTTDETWNSDTVTFFNNWGFEVPFMQFGDAYYWDDTYYDWFGIITMSDYYWIDLSEQYTAILSAEGSGYTYYPETAEYDAYFEKEDEFGNCVDIVVGFNDYGNSLTVFFGHNMKHEGTEADPYNVGDALTVITNNYYEDITETTEDFYVTGIVSGTPKTGSSGDYHFELVDFAGSSESLTIYYAKPNGFKLPEVGDTVTVAGKLAIYVTSSSATLEVKSGRMIAGTPLEPTKVVLQKQAISLLPGAEGSVQASLDYEAEGSAPAFAAVADKDYATVTVDGRNINVKLSDEATINEVVNITVSCGQLESATLKVTVLDPDAPVQEDVIHTITTATFDGLSGTSYKNYDSAVMDGFKYSANIANGNSSLQIRSDADKDGNHAGLVTSQNSDELKAAEVKITFNSNTASGRVVDIYGASSAFAINDMWNASGSSVTKLGSVTYESEATVTLTITQDVTFIGLRSSSKAIYIDSIVITWVH